MDPLLDKYETARLLGVAPRTLEQWRAHDRGPKFVRVEGQVRYRKSDLEAYLAAQTVAPTK